MGSALNEDHGKCHEVGQICNPAFQRLVMSVTLLCGSAEQEPVRGAASAAGSRVRSPTCCGCGKEAAVAVVGQVLIHAVRGLGLLIAAADAQGAGRAGVLPAAPLRLHCTHTEKYVSG